MPATFEYADNYTLGTNELKPYYHKPFYLGQIDPTSNGQSSSEESGENGINYVWKDDSVGTAPEALSAWQDSDINCGYAYKINFSGATTADTFYIIKYAIGKQPKNNINDAAIISNTARYIVGSKVNPTNYDFQCNDDAMITIDLGVRIHIKSKTAYLNSHTIWVYTAPKEVMDKRRIYHGGYATWMQFPFNEGDTSRTPIIPTSLKYKDITIVANPGANASVESWSTGTNNVYEVLHAAKSEQDIVHINARMSLFLEWNVNPDYDRNSATSSAPITNYDFDGSIKAQPNILSTILVDDIDLLSPNDFPVIAKIPYEDTIGSGVTGSTQIYNTGVSAIAGNARIAAIHLTDTVPNNDCELARNQFFPVILFIN